MEEEAKLTAMPDEPTAGKAVKTTAGHKKPTFTQYQSIIVGSLGAVMVLSDMYPGYGKAVMAAGFLMYFNAQGFI